MFNITALNEGMAPVSKSLAHKVTVILLRIKAIDSLEGKTLTIRTFPLCIINDYQQQKRLNMNIIKLQDLMTERKMWIRLGKFAHPFLIIIKYCIAVIHILFDMPLQFVNELLLIKTVNLLWDECLVMTKCRDYTTYQSNTLEETTNLMDSFVNSPALGYQFLNLLRIYHNRQTRAAEIVAHALPRHRFTRLDEHRECNNLDIG